jgi:ABC-type multidrug transport system fused ATPase/permease subunit
VIAQRLSTVRNADLVLVMNKGEIVERGQHNDLLKKNGLYKEIYDLQLAHQDQFREELARLNLGTPGD